MNPFAANPVTVLTETRARAEEERRARRRTTPRPRRESRVAEPRRD